MVEMGLTIFALFGVTLGIVQAAMIYNAMLSLNNLSREGARFTALRIEDKFLALGGTSDTAAITRQRENEATVSIKEQLSKYLQTRSSDTTIEPSKLDPGHITIQFASIRANQAVRVIITYDMKRNKGFVPSLLPLPESLANFQASSSNLIE